MRDLTLIEERFRRANPVPDAADPPMITATAAAALLDIEARSIDMKTRQEQVAEQPFPESPKHRTRVIGALVAAAVVIAVIILSVALFAGDDESGLDVVDQPESQEAEPDVDADPPDEPEPDVAATPTDEEEPDAPAAPAVEEMGFCEVEVAIGEAHDLAGFDGPSGMVELGISGQVKALYDQFVATAPEEIRTEVASTSERFVALIVVWEDANGDSNQLDRDAEALAMERFFSGVNEAEDEIVGTWIDANCP